MGKQVNIYEAKTHLSRLVEDAASGNVIIIAKDGKPMAQLGPVSASANQPRMLGQLSKHAKDIDWRQWWRDWKAADKEIETDFESAAAKAFPARRRNARPKRHR